MDAKRWFVGSPEGVKKHLGLFSEETSGTFTIRVARDIGAGNVEIIDSPLTQRTLLTVGGVKAGEMVTKVIGQMFSERNGELNLASRNKVCRAIGTNDGSATIRVVDGKVTEVTFTDGGTITM